MDLWRDLTLKLCNNRPCEFSTSWKDTYTALYSKQQIIPHMPIKVLNFSSDLLYRSWVTREFDLEISCPGIFSFSNVDRRPAVDLSYKQFVEQYEILNQPVVITGLVTQWKAYQNWDYEYLKIHFPNQIFRATSGTSSEPASFTIRQYEAYAHSSSHEEVPLYLFDRNFATQTSSNTIADSKDTSPKSALCDDYEVPQYFRYSPLSSDSKHITDLFSLLPNDIRPDHRWLIIGPHRSGSIFHIDPNQTHAWNACIKGRKKWIFYPPSVPPPGIYVTSDGADVTVPLSTGEWLLSFWKYHLQNRSSSPSASAPLEVIVEPGELIFVPHGWWHMVINLDEESMAITQNYVSSTNLIDCYEFLKDKSDQISGLRDRYNSDEYRRKFHEIFQQKLEETHPLVSVMMRDGYLERKEKERNHERNVKRKSKLAAIFNNSSRNVKEENHFHERGHASASQGNGVEEDEECLHQLQRRRKRSNSNYNLDEQSTSLTSTSLLQLPSHAEARDGRGESGCSTASSFEFSFNF